MNQMAGQAQGFMQLDDRESVGMGNEVSYRSALWHAIEGLVLFLLLAGTAAFIVRFSSMAYRTYQVDQDQAGNRLETRDSLRR